MKSSSAASRMRVRVSCGGLTVRREEAGMGGIQFKRTFECYPSESAAVKYCFPWLASSGRAGRLRLDLAGGGDRSADEGVRLRRVFDLVCNQKIELR